MYIKKLFLFFYFIFYLLIIVCLCMNAIDSQNWQGEISVLRILPEFEILREVAELSAVFCHRKETENKLVPRMGIKSTTIVQLHQTQLQFFMFYYIRSQFFCNQRPARGFARIPPIIILLCCICQNIFWLYYLYIQTFFIILRKCNHCVAVCQDEIGRPILVKYTTKLIAIKDKADLHKIFLMM